MQSGVSSSRDNAHNPHMEVSTLPRRGGGLLSHPRQVLKAFSDDRLVEQIRRGNEAAFEVVYERHHRGILSFCRHMLSSQEEAEDAVQQTFVAAYYDLCGNDKEIRLKPWLYTIARNRCLSVLRARREQPSELEDIPTAGLAEEVQQRDELRRMLADMHGLPAEQRAALVLSELGDLSHSDIANVLGCPAMKVKSLVFQARSSLIESRQARDTSCVEIREQLATLRGGALRRGHLRKHLNACEGCRDFRDDVRRQRTAMAALLPVVPSAGLKGTIMGAIGGGGAAGGGAAGLGMGTAAVAGGGAAASSGSAGLGGIVSLIAGGGATKIAVAAVVATGTVGGAAVVVSGSADSDRGPAATAAEPAQQRAGDPGSSTGMTRHAGPGAATTPAAQADDKKKKDKEKGLGGEQTLILNPDGTISVVPNGNANGVTRENGNGGTGGPNGNGNAYGRGGGGAGPGNSNGSNGTRSRGEPPAHSRGRGRDGAPAVPGTNAPPPAPPSSGDVGPQQGNRGNNGSRGPRLPSLPNLPDLPNLPK